jgi:hypothetical protein
MSNQKCKHLHTKPEVKQIAPNCRGMKFTGNLICTDCGAVITKK